MEKLIRKTKNYTLCLAVVMALLLSSCAAGNIIQPNVWLGVIDVATAVGIAVFIFRGSNK